MKLKLSDSFIEGFSMGLSIQPKSDYYIIQSLEEGQRQDYEALKGDWIEVGKAIKNQAASCAYGK